MKIIIIGPAHPFRGGIADTNESLCRSLIQQGHEASIITFTVQYPSVLFPGKTQYSSENAPENISIQRLIHSFNPINWFHVARQINQLQPDLVIVRYWIPLLAPCLGSIIKQLKKHIVKIAMCDNVIPHEKRLGDQLLTTYFTSAFDGFITLSNTTVKELEKFTTKPKTYHPHPINDHLGEPLNKQFARKHLNLKEEANYLLFFGLVRDYKGLDLTLKALAQPKLSELNIQLLVVGEFYESQEKYTQLIHSLGLENQVRLIDEFIPSEQIKYYFSATDMVIQTYKSASQSGVSQIAFHFNRPILVTDVGGLSEIIKHEKMGYVTKKQPLEIANSIYDFFTNDKQALFENNIQKEKQKYTWKSFSEELLRLYKQIK